MTARKADRVKRRIYRVRPHNRLRGPCRGGFTLVEALIALAVVVAVVVTTLSAHLASLRADARARDIAEGDRMIERATGLLWLGNDPRAVAEDVKSAGWTASFDVSGGGPEGPAWIECGVARRDRPGSRTVAWLQPGAGVRGRGLQ